MTDVSDSQVHRDTSSLAYSDRFSSVGPNQENNSQLQQSARTSTSEGQLRRGVNRGAKVLERLARHRKTVAFRHLLENMASSLKTKHGLMKVVRAIEENKRKHAIKFMEKLLLFSDFDFSLSERSSLLLNTSSLNQSINLRDSSLSLRGTGTLGSSIGQKLLPNLKSIEEDSQNDSKQDPFFEGGTSRQNGIFSKKGRQSKTKKLEEDLEEDLYQYTNRDSKKGVSEWDSQIQHSGLSPLEQMLEKDKGVYSKKGIDKVVKFEPVFYKLNRFFKNSSNLRLFFAFKTLKQVDNNHLQLLSDLAVFASDFERLRISRIQQSFSVMKMSSQLEKMKSANFMFNKLRKMIKTRKQAGMEKLQDNRDRMENMEIYLGGKKCLQFLKRGEVLGAKNIDKAVIAYVGNFDKEIAKKMKMVLKKRPKIREAIIRSATLICLIDKIISKNKKKIKKQAFQIIRRVKSTNKPRNQVKNTKKSNLSDKKTNNK